MPVIGSEVAAARKSRNMSRENLAMMSGVSLDKIIRIENGLQANPRLDDFMLICGVLGLSPLAAMRHPNRTGAWNASPTT